MLRVFFGVLIFFFKKRKPTKILLRLNCASGEFFAAHCYIFSLSRETLSKHEKKQRRWQQQFVVFFLCAFFDKKYCAEEENELFFEAYSLWQHKKLLSDGERFFPRFHPRFRKKHISAIKKLFSAFFIFRNDKRRESV